MDNLDRIPAEDLDLERSSAPRRDSTEYLRHRARMYTEMALDTVLDVLDDKGAPPQARLQAANMLWERGYGKTEQPHTIEAGQSLVAFLREVNRRAALEDRSDHANVIDVEAEDDAS